ncbi:Methylthioribose kinase [bacterium HR39]|nr:Methylthioribose kinase [bacterium HR39]
MDERADLARRCRELVEELGLARAEDVVGVEPLTGGVASDIARVELRDGLVFCAKFALPRLRVVEEWRAPVRRNRAEYAWLGVAARIVPENAVRLFGRSERLHGFVMEYLGGPAVRNWKAELLAGRILPGVAAALGDLVGRIHAASARPDFDRAPFRNMEDFRALRIEPYLLFTATRHPDLAPRLEGLAHMLERAHRALVHGDVSPKNVLVRAGRPLLLDAECATMGDPAFDPAFCVNHLLLKAVHMPHLASALRGEASAFLSAWLRHVDFEDRAGLEARVAGLVPALMLARVDGKSPVEYLDGHGRARVRRIARRLLVEPPRRVGDLFDRALAPDGGGDG